MNKFYSVIFDYDTTKIVTINSKIVGILNRFIQLAIIAYLIGFVIIHKSGYQEYEDVNSAVVMKVKGVLLTNTSQSLTINSQPSNNGENRIWDVADYVVPPIENGAFFVTTNALITQGQAQGKCSEDPRMLNVNCTSDVDCEVGQPVVNGNGVKTGRCNHGNHNNSSSGSSDGVCEIYAWCPVEQDNQPKENARALLEKSGRFTVLIKNHIEFQKFHVKRRNIIDTQNATYLKSCTYSSTRTEDSLCPIFKLKTIVEEAGQNYADIALKGGIISIGIHWDCNLDYDISNCLPVYSFRRIDDEQTKIANGWNFRYANFYYKNDTRYRDLVKAYGILFVVKVTGRGRKFNVVPLLLNIGSGLGLLAVATVTCDILILYFLNKKDLYRKSKYLYINDTDESDYENSTDDTRPIVT